MPSITLTLWFDHDLEEAAATKAMYGMRKIVLADLEEAAR